MKLGQTFLAEVQVEPLIFLFYCYLLVFLLYCNYCFLCFYCVIYFLLLDFLKLRLALHGQVQFLASVHRF